MLHTISSCNNIIFLWPEYFSLTNALTKATWWRKKTAKNIIIRVITLQFGAFIYDKCLRIRNSRRKFSVLLRVLPTIGLWFALILAEYSIATPPRRKNPR